MALQAFSLGGLSLPDWFVLCAVYGSAIFDVSGLVALALWMPALDEDLCAIVVAPFEVNTFRRLGQLHAEVGRRGW